MDSPILVPGYYCLDRAMSLQEAARHTESRLTTPTGEQLHCSPLRSTQCSSSSLAMISIL